MGKYLNLKNKEMFLDITRYKAIHIKKGISEYPEDIANKFPSILKKIEEEIKTELDEEKNEIDLEQMSKKELEEILNEKGIEIEGRKTKSKMIDAIKNNI